MKLSPVYLLVGEEKLLQDNALAKIKQQCFPPEVEGLTDFNYISLDGQTTTSNQLITEVQQLPFMTPRRLVVVKNAKLVLDEPITDYLQNPVTTTCLVFIDKKIDKRLSLYKTFKKHAEVIEFDSLNHEELVSWIQKYVKDTGKKLSATNAIYIANNMESNLSSIKQELDKLITFIGTRDKITSDDINLLLSENKLRGSFDLTNAIQAKNAAQAITIANDLISQGKTIPDIIGLLRWMLLRLWQGKEVLEKRGKKAVSSELRVPYFFLNRFIEQIHNFSIDELKTGIITLLDTEKYMRTYSLPKKLLLEILLFKLIYPKKELLTTI